MNKLPKHTYVYVYIYIRLYIYICNLYIICVYIYIYVLFYFYYYCVIMVIIITIIIYISYIYIIYILQWCTKIERENKDPASASQPWPAALAYLALENHPKSEAEKNRYPEVLLEGPQDSNLQNQTDRTSVFQSFIVRMTLLSWWAIRPAQPFSIPQTKPLRAFASPLLASEIYPSTQSICSSVNTKRNSNWNTISINIKQIIYHRNKIMYIYNYIYIYHQTNICIQSWRPGHRKTPSKTGAQVQPSRQGTSSTALVRTLLEADRMQATGFKPSASASCGVGEPMEFGSNPRKPE